MKVFEVARLQEDHCLRRGYVEALAAAHITAHQHIVDADHVIARILKTFFVVLVNTARRLFFAGSLYPPDIVFIALTAHRARECSFLGFLFFVEYVAFLHNRIVTF